MLYARWQTIAKQHAERTAVFDPHGGRDWTFAELARAVEEAGRAHEPVLFAAGHDVAFFIDVLRAWRDGLPVLPLERGQAPPVVPRLEPGIVHLKQTSGTTGEPRLIAFTAEQLAADADNIISTMGLHPDLPNIAAISLAHSYGFSNLVTPLLLHGIPVVLSPTPLPEMVKRAADGHEQLALPAVPAMWRAWHAAHAIPPNVRIAISAGAPLPIELENTVFDRCGLKIHNFCGASECGGIAYDRSDTPRADASLIGEAMDNVQLSINDGGCLVVRSNAVGSGYFPPDDTALSGRRFVTSDLAELVGGQLRIIGRASDVINVAGRKLSPEAVEAVVRGIQGVNDCVAFGVPSKDDSRCDEVAIAVELNEGMDATRVRQQTLAELPAWQVPRHWWAVERIEPNGRGKVSRAEWRQSFLRLGW